MKKKSFQSNQGFVFLEALFCLVILSFAFSLYAGYLAMPKFPPKDKQVLYPKILLDVKDQILESKNHLFFQVQKKKWQEGEDIYFSFEVKQ